MMAKSWERVVCHCVLPKNVATLFGDTQIKVYMDNVFL
jgi:hypothetical protein